MRLSPTTVSTIVAVTYRLNKTEMLNINHIDISSIILVIRVRDVRRTSFDVCGRGGLAQMVERSLSM